MIYLDHNATSPVLEEVRAAMDPWSDKPANPASMHQAGQRARMAVEEAREQIAALVGGRAAGVVFTSGATEANHMFLRGAAAQQEEPGALALSAIEHPCVRAAAAELERAGWTLHWLPVGPDGRVRPELPAESPALVSLMAANHETGVIQPVQQLRARLPDARFHVDASQAAGRIPLQLEGVEGVVLSSHKLGGPAGIGALVLPDGEPFPALLSGGSQQRGRRAGSLPVALAVGFGAACALARRELARRQERNRPLSRLVRQRLQELGAQVIGDAERTLPNTTCGVFPDLSGDVLVSSLDLEGVCVSSGAACASGSSGPSPVLLAMGHPFPRGGLRISLGPRTRRAEVLRAMEILGRVVARARSVEL